jgi:hypothetical protein
LLNRRGLAVLFAVAAAPVAGCRRQAPPPPVASTPPPAAPARRAPREPFTHPLLAQAERAISNEDCSRGALWAVTQQVRGMHKQAAQARAAQKAKRRDPAASCLPPAGEELAKVVRGPLLDRVGGCVGRDGPYDPEWDTVNSAVLSLGVCLDCSRPPEQRGGDCKHAIEAIDRAAKAVQRGAAADSLAQAPRAK